MSNLIDRLKKLFGIEPEKGNPEAIEPTMNESTSSWNVSGQDSTSPVLNANILKALMQQVEETKEGMYTCEETSELLDEYVDLVDSEQDAAQIMPLVKAHLDACPGCQQRYEILLDIVSANLEDI